MAALQPGDPEQLGPYRLLGRLGSGGMGQVFLGRSPGGRLVAVKVIRAELAEDAEFRARFAREVDAARRVGGLFTAQVVDAQLDGPVPWIVSAYVAGPSLASAVAAGGPLPIRSVTALAAALAEGLSAIHAVGVIHRDLKPSNVLLAEDGPRIIDFGISRASEATSLTGTGLMIGSPGFMSPEQAQGYDVGSSSDVFSLGGVLTFAARGEGPFGKGDTVALLYRVVHSQPNLEDIPGRLQRLIAQCLSRDPRHRPTASGLLADLTAAYPGAADPAVWQTWRDLPAPGLPGGDEAAPAVDLRLPTGSSAWSTMTASASAVATPPGAPSRPYPTPPATQLDDFGGPVLPPLPPRPGSRSGLRPESAARRWAQPWWPWAAGAIAALVALIVVLVTTLGGSPGTPAAAAHTTRSSSSSTASPNPAPSPVLRPSSSAPARRPATSPPAPAAAPVHLSMTQLRVGDCLTGSNLPLGTDNNWPALVEGVSCGQRHRAEVFFADDRYWAAGLGFPGDDATTNQATTECNRTFAAYDGIPDSQSIYTWDFIDPSGSDWRSGERELICIAYRATSSQPSGAPLFASIKGTSS